MTDADREVLLLVKDLAPYGVSIPDAARYEKFEKTRYLEGSTELVYEFRLPEDWRGPGVYIYVLASVEKDESSARFAHGAEKLALGAAAKFEDYEYEERKGFFPYGDDSTFYAIKAKGEQVGSYFTTRFGTRVYSVMLMGIEFYRPEAWAALIKPKLEKFAAYRP